MLSRLKRKLFPMDGQIDNLTLSEYKRVRNISIAIYIIILQLIYCLKEVFNLQTLGFIYNSDDVEEFIMGILVNAATFTIIYVVVLFAWERIWVSFNRNKCYLAGTWYHVYDRKVDENKNYVRAGKIEIRQNFFDITVNAYNYDIYYDGDKLICDDASISNWYFSISSLAEDGTIDAKFVKSKEYSESLSSSGVITLTRGVGTECFDEKGNIIKLFGTTSDSGASTVKGNIRLFKQTNNRPIVVTDEKGNKTTLGFPQCGPQPWRECIQGKLEGKSKAKFSLKKLVYAAADMIPAQFEDKKRVAIKEDNVSNEVTKFDVEIQQFIMNAILREYPDARFLGEEDTDKKEESDIKGEDVFVIDPIDGTTNFINNCRFSCISVARLKGNEVVEAAVYNPYLNEMFYAEKDKGASLNDQRLDVMDAILKNSIVGFTNCPYDRNYLAEDTFKFGNILFDHSKDLRRMGSSALEICYSACGRYQLYCEMILYPWDYLAASLIVKEAGGVITDLNGEELKLTERCSVVSGSPTAHDEVVQLYQQYIQDRGSEIDYHTDLYTSPDEKDKKNT